MAKKNKKEREPVYRTLNELSDSEVIKYAEWMSYPMYLDQFNNSPLSSVDTDTHLTNCDVEQVANSRLIQLQNGFYRLNGTDMAIDKKHPVVATIKEMVDREYDDGRTTVMGDAELEEMFKKADPKLSKIIRHYHG